MVYIKNLFFEADEWVVQFMPPPDNNINTHPFCLHMWRYQEGPIVNQPWFMV